LQVDTSNVLFICGGAFAGLENIVAERVETSSMGFGAEVHSKGQRDVSKLFALVTTEDLMRFGLIPEFLGRLPVVCCLEELTEDALIDILTKPKNAIVRQFQKLFSFENCELTFTEGALRAVVKEAIKRKTGARGLRSILEGAMLSVMYELPDRKDTKEVVVTEECIINKAHPIMVFYTEEEMKAVASGDAAAASSPSRTKIGPR
jgi:ATP-dependent Clp protease ATP-binding subunit ClpX